MKIEKWLATDRHRRIVLCKDPENRGLALFANENKRLIEQLNDVNDLQGVV